MRKVTGKKKDSTNGEDDGIELQDQESDVENGDDNTDADADQNGDAKGKDGDASETNDEDDDDLPLKETVKKPEKGGRGRKKGGKAKKEKKRVTLDVPEGDGDDDDDDEPEEEYEVADIVAHKYIGKKLYYQIRWKNYGADDDTWEPKDSLSCPEIIKKYEAANDTSKDSANLGGGKGKGAKGKRGRPASSGKGGAKPKKAKKAESDDDEEGDPEKEYEVQKILNVRNKKNGSREFLVHWKGWSSRFDSWEPEDNLNCEKLIEEFDAKIKKAKNTTAKELRIAPKATKHFTSSSNRAGGVRASKRGRAGGKERVTYYDDE